MSESKYLGMDLGTSNSAAAIFVDGEVEIVLNERGDVNTPSIVQVTEDSVIVGKRAQKKLHTDPVNTFKEFKRLMGTATRTAADRNDKCWSAEELAAEVLKSLKGMAEKTGNRRFDKVVITVPALFELPQSKATGEAARLAGFEHVELLPEPVASALASGWKESGRQRAWLVYDLGGGTFDASLLESRDGLLRVVGHDGDNFLGGRDIDRAIVSWVLEQLKSEQNLTLSSSSDDHTSSMRHIESAAEKAKIRLSSVHQTVIELEFRYEGRDYEVDLTLTRDQLDEICGPLIDKSISICQGLLQSHGLDRSALDRVVLVGGPAHMPLIQRTVAESLAPLAESNQDPMALVAHGAAIYAATMGLGCEQAMTADTEADSEPFQVWLQYPSICTELDPTVMGRIVDSGFSPSQMQLVSSDESWSSALVDVDATGVFMIEAQIGAGSKDTFSLRAFDRHGSRLAISHPRISIVHGVSMSDPPLSRSIGLALANGTVKRFIERGTALPAKRTFVQSTVETLTAGSNQQLEIPIVQGERHLSRFCRQVGSLVVPATRLKRNLHVGSPVEITIEVDRGGDLKAFALLKDQGVLVEGVAHLVMICSDPATLRSTSHELNQRLTSRLQASFRDRDEATLTQLNDYSLQLQGIFREGLDQLDADACLRISRQLMEIEAHLEMIETREQMGYLVEELESTYFSTHNIVSQFGDETDKRILEECRHQMDQAVSQPRQEVLARLIERLNTLHQSAHEKSPEFWRDVFEYWASFAHEASNQKKAQKIVEQGRAEIVRGNFRRLRQMANELYALIPARYKKQGGEGSIESGVY